MMRRTSDKIEEGSGNIFADLGFPNAEREQLKADLVLQSFLPHPAPQAHASRGW
jgi:hypothetical protein